MTGKKVAWTMIAWMIVAVAAAVVVGLLLRTHRMRSLSLRRSVPIEGAVIQRDADTKKQLPIADVVITATDGVATATTQSDASGHFKMVLERGVLSGQPVVVRLRHPEYEPLEFDVETGRLQTSARLYVAAMVPLPAEPEPSVHGPEVVVSNILVRYTINSRTETNVGSAVRTFQVVNEGNVPCEHHAPCSPDGKWKASTGSVSLDAGLDNMFGNVRASCIAGPCPFTRIDSQRLYSGRPHDQGVGAELVGYGDVPAGGGGRSHGDQLQRSATVSGDLWPHAQLHAAADAGGRQPGGGSRRQADGLSPEPRPLHELGHVHIAHRYGEREDDGLPLRIEAGIPVLILR